MSEQADTVAAIRARWAGVVWRCEEAWDTTSYCGDVYLLDVARDVAILDIDEPAADELDFLRLAAQAPHDIRALLAWPELAKAEAAALRQAAIDLANQLAVLRFPDESTLWRLGGQGLERDYQALKAALATDAGARLLTELAELHASQAATQAFVRGLTEQLGADDVPLTVAISRLRAEALAARRLATAARSALSGPATANYAALADALAAWEAVTRKGGTDAKP